MTFKTKNREIGIFIYLKALSKDWTASDTFLSTF